MIIDLDAWEKEASVHFVNGTLHPWPNAEDGNRINARILALIAELRSTVERVRELEKRDAYKTDIILKATRDFEQLEKELAEKTEALEYYAQNTTNGNGIKIIAHPEVPENWLSYHGPDEKIPVSDIYGYGAKAREVLEKYKFKEAVTKVLTENAELLKRLAKHEEEEKK